MTAFLKSTNGPIHVGLDRLHKHIQLGIIREKSRPWARITLPSGDVYTVNVVLGRILGELRSLTGMSLSDHHE